MPRDVKLTYLKKAKKFLDKNPRLITENEVDILVVKSIQKVFLNRDTNIDVKQLQGDLKSFGR